MCPRNGIKHNAVINVPQPILSVVDSCLVFYFVLTYMTNMVYMLAPLHNTVPGYNTLSERLVEMTF